MKVLVPEREEVEALGDTRRRVTRFPGTVSGAAVSAIVVLALVLRVWRIGDVGFNSDEAVYAGQAASLAGNPLYIDLFPVFRAHPLLVHTLLAPLFAQGVVDTVGRVIVALLGTATVWLVFLLARRLYDTSTGLIAALITAVMPYHVVVSRQVLLDVPMVFFATVTLYCLARWAESQRTIWVFATGIGMGVTMLAKESSIVLLGSIYAFLALTPSIQRPIRSFMIVVATLICVFAVHPLTLALSGGGRTGKSYLLWQLLRRPNHSWSFYLEQIPWAIGPLIFAAVALALWYARREFSWREVLLLCWSVVPVVAFELYPVKGYQYLLPIAPPLSVLAARGFTRIRLPRFRQSVMASGVLVAITVVSLIVPTSGHLDAPSGASYLAGTGGVPGGRETGRWVAENIPEGSVLLTIGPSMANILQYYGHRRAYALSVSPNPLHRNPSYVPLSNPDRSLRFGHVNYVVWDTFSARRSPTFSRRLLALTRRYNGRMVHTEYISHMDPGGQRVRTPAVVVYRVRP
jgi:hypothetical protein